ncbi:HAD family hydrolase [Clostridium sp. Ade.TY]|uniref:HAD family hydrolase n=1 Tax=Clostridium sp. Ade.TY TaxID=1391647 RepID=UPI000427144C|nr:HAD family hydrolase [Clostridium sp. Ade.TY]
MIKLIASDMDGTLLTPEGKVPSEFFDTLKKLKEKNIEFVVASGRPYKTLYENFKPISDEISYVSDNGAMVVENGKIKSIEVMDKQSVIKIVDACKKLKNSVAVFCGVKNFYHIACDKKFTDEINKYYLDNTIIDCYDYIKTVDDEIFKISICDMDNALTNSFKVISEVLGDEFKVVVAGKYWTDVTNKNVNKGNAIKKIQSINSITPKETMVFGDYFNDIEMLNAAYYSYVMEDALDEVKKHGNFIAKSNKENGVIEAINNIIK